MQIVLAILVLMLLILVHEWGHFIVALKVGVPVREFSIGFGPLLLSKQRRGVQYSLRLIPLGGYVRMTGEDEDFEAEDGFVNRKPWEKIAIAAAGPIMNFVAAIVLFILIFSVLGMPKALNEPVLGGTVENMPAAAAGLQEGDRCLEINGEKVSTWEEFSSRIASAEPGETLSLRMERDGAERMVEVQPVYNAEQDRMVLGIYNSVVYERVSILKAIPAGFQQTWSMTLVLLEGLGMLFSGQVGADELSGPVGITTMIGDAAQSGTVTLLAFMAFLSVNLGLLNLLPIPALDGSKMLFAVVEWIRGKRIDPDREAMINWVGFLLMMGLMVMATYNDIERLIQG